MRILLDTGVLLRFFNSNDPLHLPVRKYVFEMLGKDEVRVAPQCIYEFMVVATRSTIEGGFGKSTSDLTTAFDRIKNTFLCEADPKELLDIWFNLVVHHKVAGKQVHDARLVAYMNCLAIDAIFTLNPADFKRYGVNVLSPELAS